MTNKPRLRKTPNVLNGRDKQPGEQGAAPEPQRLERKRRRARERATEKRQARKPAGTGRQRMERWRIESHVELVRQANRFGWYDYEGTPAQRKRLCIRLARAQARAAGVSNSTWACATREERAKLIEAAAR